LGFKKFVEGANHPTEKKAPHPHNSIKSGAITKNSLETLVSNTKTSKFVGVAGNLLELLEFFGCVACVNIPQKDSKKILKRF